MVDFSKKAEKQKDEEPTLSSISFNKDKLPNRGGAYSPHVSDNEKDLKEKEHEALEIEEREKARKAFQDRIDERHAAKIAETARKLEEFNAMLNPKKSNKNPMDKAAQYQNQVPTPDPKAIFHTEADTFADNIVKEIVTKYANLAGDKLLIKNLAKQLYDKNLNTVTNWAEEFLTAQRDLITKSSNRIREFNGLNGNQLLSEVLEFSQQTNKEQGIMKWFSNKFSNSEGYNLKVTTLKTQVKQIFPILVDYSSQAKKIPLPLYIAVLSVADEALKDKDKLLEDAFYNRRVLLTGAVTNLQMLDNQLTQTLELITGMLNEISHIMDVVLPAIKMKS